MFATRRPLPPDDGGVTNNVPIQSPSNPMEDDLKEGEAPVYGSGTGYQADADISHKQFRYNPPLHSSSQFVVPALGDVRLKKNEFYDEVGAPKDYTERWAKEGLNTLRLGRIIQHHMAPGQVSQMKYRWGFRFLYNPTSISYVSSRNDSFVIDPRSETNRVLSGVYQNFQSVSFTVLLDRTPDVLSGIPDTSAYRPSLRSGDKSGILRYGTHWDMEALFRICNGEWNLTDRGKTANMGVLMPSNARLILGQGVNFYGFVGSVTWNDELFSADMVPIRTRLDIVFRRHVDMTAEQAEKSFPGIATSQEGTTTSDEGAVDSGTAGNNMDAPVPGYNRVTTGFYGYSNHNGWDYGAGGVNGKAVHATHAGVVERVRSLTTSYGKHVYVRYGNVQMIYAHLSSFNPSLREGATIKAGDWIGRVGSTGNSSGPHLHYEERVNGKARIPVFANNTGGIRR